MTIAGVWKGRYEIDSTRSEKVEIFDTKSGQLIATLSLPGRPVGKQK